ALSQSYDLVFASSSVHYTRNPYALMERLCTCAREWLMLTRMPFVERSADFVVVQRPHRYGYMTEYPGWIMNRKRFLDFLRDHGFCLERQFLVAEQPHVCPMHPNRRSTTDSCFDVRVGFNPSIGWFSSKPSHAAQKPATHALRNRESLL